jgi:hypothetical protein
MGSNCGRQRKKMNTSTSSRSTSTPAHPHHTRSRSRREEPPDLDHQQKPSSLATDNPFSGLSPQDDSSVTSTPPDQVPHPLPLPAPNNPSWSKPSSAGTDFSSHSFQNDVGPALCNAQPSMAGNTNDSSFPSASTTFHPPRAPSPTPPTQSLADQIQNMLMESERRLESKFNERIQSLSNQPSSYSATSKDHTSNALPTSQPTVLPTDDPQPVKPSPILSNPVKHHTTQSDKSSLFGQNEFTIACKGKVKYIEMENYLKNRSLTDDSPYELEKIYTSIIRAIGFIFEFELFCLPSFRDLDSSVNFSNIFLSGISDGQFLKCQSVFNRIGEILKDKLVSSSFISSTKAPKTALIIASHPVASGWSLLEMILRSRHVLCGAVPDHDLDDVRSSLRLQHKESFHDFFRRTQRLINDYELQHRDHSKIPMTKITKRFVDELNHSHEYVPYLTGFQSQLFEFISTHGTHDGHASLPFSIANVYEYFVRVRAPSIPSSLRPLRSTTSLPTSTISSSYDTSASTNQSPATIASLDIFCQPTDESIDPTINALNRSREKCPACLMGFHDVNDCYHRGPNFRDPAFNRRINVFNKQFGDKPPDGHKIREWKPQSPTPIHQPSNRPRPHQPSSISENVLSNLNKTRRPQRPFQNASTKTQLSTSSPAISNLESSAPASLTTIMDELADSNLITPPTDSSDPSISSMFSSQSPTIHFSSFDNDSNSPVICSAASLPPKRLQIDPSPAPFQYHSSAQPPTSIDFNS